MNKTVKRILSVLMTICLLLVFAGCENANSKKDAENENGIKKIDGEWVLNVGKITSQTDEESLASFSDAFKGYKQARYEPLIFLGSSIQNGINYQFLCRKNANTIDKPPAWSVITINKDKAGTSSILSITDLDISGYMTLNIPEDDSDTEKGWVLNQGLCNSEFEDADAYNLFCSLTDGIMGTQFNALALLGSCESNGNNYAVLCKKLTPAAEVEEHLCILYISDDESGGQMVLANVPFIMNRFVQ